VKPVKLGEGLERRALELTPSQALPPAGKV